jgi:hypothetical protein
MIEEIRFQLAGAEISTTLPITYFFVPSRGYRPI